MGSHNPPPLGLIILARTHFLLQLMWTPQSTPFVAQRPCWHIASCPPPFGTQPPRWDIARCRALIPFVMPKPAASRYCPLWAFSFGLPLKVFKMGLLGRSFHTLIKNASFSSPTDRGSHMNFGPYGRENVLTT